MYLLGCSREILGKVLCKLEWGSGSKNVKLYSLILVHWAPSFVGDAPLVMTEDILARYTFSDLIARAPVFYFDGHKAPKNITDYSSQLSVLVKWNTNNIFNNKKERTK